MYDIEKIKDDLKNSLSSIRYDHSIRVAEEAKKLAGYYHYDQEKAYVAGLIHDIAKEFGEEQNKEWINSYQLSSELLMEKYKPIIHADIGALIAKKTYHLTDDVCDAIRYHTIGNKKMDTLAKIVFLADKIGRKDLPPALQKVKEFAYQNLDEAMVECLLKQQENLESKGKIMHPDSIELLKYLTQAMEQEKNKI